MKKFLFVFAVITLFSSLLLAQDGITGREEQLKPRYEKREAFTVVGIETLNDMEDETYTGIWTDFMEIQPEIFKEGMKEIYGITYTIDGSDPEHAGKYMYFVGMEAVEGMKIPEKVKMHKVPAGYYAVFEHHGNIESIEDTYEYIYGKWIMQSGQKPADQDMFELYNERFHPESDDCVVEIWVPILPKDIQMKPDDGIQKTQKQEINPMVAPDVVPEKKPDVRVEKE